jgi:hypothetical protein
MLRFEPLCLSTQSVISLRLKLKRGLNPWLLAHVGLEAPAFECSIRDFTEWNSVCAKQFKSKNETQTARADDYSVCPSSV